MTHWAGVVADTVKQFCSRRRWPVPDLTDYRDIDPVDVRPGTKWIDEIGRTDRADIDLIFVLFGERTGTPVPKNFRFLPDIRQKLSAAGLDRVTLPADGSPNDPKKLELTGTLFEFFDAYLPHEAADLKKLKILWRARRVGGHIEWGCGLEREHLKSSSRTIEEDAAWPAGYRHQLQQLTLLYDFLYSDSAVEPTLLESKDALVHEIQEFLIRRYGDEPRDPLVVELPGPRSYDLPQTDLYCGRNELVAAARIRFIDGIDDRTRRFGLVEGVSGSGKSSLLRAGLRPLVKAPVMRRGGWRDALISLADIDPNRPPLVNLVHILVDADAVPELGDPFALTGRMMMPGANAALILLEALAATRPERPNSDAVPRLLLIADQLERALNGLRDAAEEARWRPFLTVLGALGGATLRSEPEQYGQLAARFAEKCHVMVVIGLPSDRKAELGAVFSRHAADPILEVDATVDKAAIESIVRQTFEGIGLGVSEDAVELLLDDALAVSGRGPVLPLLSTAMHNLHEKWKERQRIGISALPQRLDDVPRVDLAGRVATQAAAVNMPFLTRSDVENDGRLERAIDSLGDKAFIQAQEREDEIRQARAGADATVPQRPVLSGEAEPVQAALDELLRLLVEIPEDTDSPRLKTVPASAIPMHCRPLVEALQDHRLAYALEDQSLSLVHAAILSHWTLGKEFISSEQRFFDIERHARHDADAYHSLDPNGVRARQRLSLWSDPESVEEIVDLLARRGYMPDTALDRFLVAATVEYAGQSSEAAGRVLMAASFFNDEAWLERTLSAAADKKQAANHVGKNGGCPLNNAASQGATRVVDILLGAGANPNQRSPGEPIPLIGASQAGHLAVVEKLIEAGADPNSYNDAGFGPLAAAATGGHPDVASVLLRKGADPFHPDAEGVTPLIYAAQAGHAEIVAQILARADRSQFGSEINRATKTGYTALMAAADGGHEAVVSRLVAAGAAKDAQQEGGLTALMFAADSGHLEVVRILLGGGANADLHSKGGSTALMLALDREHVETARSLLSRTRNVDWKNDDGRTALMFAASRGLADAAAELLRAGADPRATDNFGFTALHLAALAGNTAIVDALMTAGVDRECCTRNGKTALMWAAFAGHLDIVNRLAQDATVGMIDVADEDGYTALFLAVLQRHNDIVSALLASHAVPDVAGRDKRTPLLMAAAFGMDSMIAQLIGSGANPNLADGSGRTPLMAAAQAGRADIVRKLIEAGGDVNLHDNFGQTALMLAVLFGRAATVELLLKSGARIDATNSSDATVLFYAAESRNTSGQQNDPLFPVTLEFLLRTSAADMLDRPNDDGITPLMHAASIGATIALKLLADAGADLDRRDAAGDTALAFAARANFPGSVDELLTRRIDPNTANTAGDTPLILAAQSGSVEIVSALLKAGADAAARNEAGLSALDCAKLAKNETMIELLTAKPLQ